MHIITAPRRGGKTYRLVEALRKNPNGLMLTASHAHACWLRTEYPDVAERIEHVRSREHHAGSSRDLYLDNADIVLWDLLGARVEMATLTGSSEHLVGFDPLMQVNEGL